MTFLVCVSVHPGTHKFTLTQCLKAKPPEVLHQSSLTHRSSLRQHSLGLRSRKEARQVYTILTPRALPRELLLLGVR